MMSAVDHVATAVQPVAVCVSTPRACVHVSQPPSAL